MLNFQTSISALRANQVAISTIANNIANANTPGYHRQTTQFSTIQGDTLGFNIGSGVQVSAIFQSFNLTLETARLENLSQSSSVAESLTSLRQIETALGTGEGSIHDRLNEFFSDLGKLAVEPDNQSMRKIAVDRVETLAGEFRSVSGQLDTLQHTGRQQIRFTVEQANLLLREMHDLNQKIVTENAMQDSSNPPHDLLDQFRQKVSSLSELIGASAQLTASGGFSIQIGEQFHVEGTLIQLEYAQDSAGDYQVQLASPDFGTDISLELNGGRIGALNRIVDQRIPEIKDELYSLVNEFVFQVDQIHSTGLAQNGGYQFLTSQRTISSLSQPVSEISAFDNLSAGSIFVTLENEATGEKTLTEITFDPATESVNDLVGKLNAIPNLQAGVSGASPSVTIAATNGYKFDFAGRPQTFPDTSNITGTTIPQASGVYSGNANEVFRFEFTGSGTVGVSDNLSLQVFNQDNVLVGEYSVGSGYEPDSLLEIVDGIQISLTSGTVNAGDEFSVTAVAQADNTGTLAALGINSLFTGSTAHDIDINKSVLADPQRLALGKSGSPGDNTNLIFIQEIREATLFENGTTVEQFAAQINLGVAQEISSLTDEQFSLEFTGQQLAQQIDSISGVDPNEETVFLLEYQRSYEASVRVISTIDQVLQELFSII